MTEAQRPKLTVSGGRGDPSWVVEWHGAIDSTMKRMTELARSGAGSDRVVVADFQSAGRGTHGRNWIAPPRTCLMFSFMLANLISLQDLADLPLRVATVVAGRLNADFDLDVRVDPPNDLTIGGRKLAGTLCQSHLRGTDISWVVCGIGLNTNLSRDQIQVPGSTSLLIESGYRVDHEQLLGSLLEVLAPIRAS